MVVLDSTLFSTLRFSLTDLGRFGVPASAGVALMVSSGAGAGFWAQATDATSSAVSAATAAIMVLRKMDSPPNALRIDSPINPEVW